MAKRSEQTYQLANLILTIPPTTATAERCFSALTCFRTYLRSTRSQETPSQTVTPVNTEGLTGTAQEKPSQTVTPVNIERLTGTVQETPSQTVTPVSIEALTGTAQENPRTSTMWLLKNLHQSTEKRNVMSNDLNISSKGFRIAFLFCR
jgi:hypothetical protein